MKTMSDETYPLALVTPGVLAASAANTTSSVDMETCREGQLIIMGTTDAADEITTMTVEHSDDDSTFAGVDAFAVSPETVDAGIDDIAVAQAGFLARYDIHNMKRYVRLKYTSVKSGTSYFAALLIGCAARHKPPVN